MIARVFEVLALLLVVAVAGSLIAARVWPDPVDGFYGRLAALGQPTKDLGAVDFAQIERRAGRNDALICPDGLCAKAKPTMVAPVYPMPPAELLRKIRDVAEAEPSVVELPGAAPAGQAARFVQYSVLFRFPDVIDVRVIDAGAKGSTLAIYSRSVVGEGDFGVNEARVKRWLDALARIAQTG